MIRVVSTQALPGLKDRCRSAWLYIGSYKGLTSASGYLPDEKRIFIGRMIEEVTAAVRDRFVDYIGAMAELQQDKVLWYSSRMASKSNSQTLIFDHYVYFKLLEALASREKDDILVVTDDHDFLKVMGRVGGKNMDVAPARTFCMSRVRRCLQGYIQLVRYGFFWLLGRLLTPAPSGACDVVIHSWIDQRTFNDLAGFHDPYFGGLEGWFKKQDLVVRRMAPLMIPLRHMGALRRRFRSIIYPLRSVSFRDLWRVLGRRFTITILEDGREDGVVLRELVINEAWRENCENVYMGNLLLFHGYRGLFERLKDTAAVIYPFENQPWEKMLMLALPDKIRKIGYAHAAIPYNWLDYRTSALERSAPCPDVILTAGQRWADFLRPFYPNIPVEVAGAIRYTHLIGPKGIRPAIRHPQSVVVALPLDPLIAFSLQVRLLALAREGKLDGFCVKIKAHPYLPADAVLTPLFLKYKNCVFVHDNIHLLLADCSLLVTAASTVAFESLAMGVKTLVYVPESVSWEVEYFIKDHIFLAYEDDFSERFIDAVNDTGVVDWDVTAYFSQPDFSVFSKMLMR